MNPQYASPQQYGITQNSYGGYPNQGIPPPAPQNPPLPVQNQQPFPPQPGLNTFPGYSVTPNQGNAVPPAVTSPQSPLGNAPSYGGIPNSNYPPQPGLPNQVVPNFPHQPQTGGKSTSPPDFPHPPSLAPQNPSAQQQNQIGPEQLKQMPQSNMPPLSSQPTFPSANPAVNAPSLTQSQGSLPTNIQTGGGPPGQATHRGVSHVAPSAQQNPQHPPVQQHPQVSQVPSQSTPPQNMLLQTRGPGANTSSLGPSPPHPGFASSTPSGMTGPPLGAPGYGGTHAGVGSLQGHGGLPSGPGSLIGGQPPASTALQGPGGPPPGPGFYPPQQRMPMPPRPGTTFPNPANPENLVGQVAGMNLNGPAPPMPGPNQQMSMNGPPRMSHPGIPPMPGQRFPSVNGGPAPQMNGIPDPNAPRPPMQQRYPQDGTQNVQAYPSMSSPGEYPPQPGYMPQSAPYAGHQPGYPPGQQQKRLDPDHMPSPIQVVMEDQQSKSGLFYTNQKGQVPPLVTTDFVTVDQGNASPRFMRSTMYNVPVTAEMMKQSAVPFALVISPMAELSEEEHPPPLVDFGETGPVRCIRCKAYMCPNMNFFDGGRRFLCLLCKASTEVPPEYFQHLDHTGLRVDRYERAELMLGAYDIVATKEYCRDSVPPKPPALIFLIDVSYNNIKSGLVSLLCSQMKSFLFNLPKERGQEKSSLRVGFITYNSSVHFYNVNPNLGQPQMLVVGDVQEMFMPLLDGFLADVEQSASLIDMLMQQIPTMFGDTRETETVLAPAIQAGLEALKAAGCAGKLLVFHSSLPTLEAPGRLKNRDDRKLLGTEKEKTVLMPQNKVYNDLGQDCVQAGCSVDLFIFNNAFVDLATIGQVARLTGGEVYKYTYFQADLDGERLVNDVRANVKRLCAFDAIMRVRTSTGVRPTDFFGHFFMSNTTDIELAAIDPDKAVAVEIKHDDKLNEEDGVFVQAALLYTSLSGQRKIRILNLALKACCQMTELYRTCELDTIMNFFSKQAVFKLMDATPKAIRENYIQRSAQILACYRKNCASPTSAGQLILPECMKLLPLYMNCMLKSDAVSGGSDMTIDDRWFTMAAVSTMDVPSSVVYLYPRLISLGDLGDSMPTPIRCSAEKMGDGGVYLLENGIYMFLWIGLSVPSEWVSAVFGVPNAALVDTDKNRLPELDDSLSQKIRDIIDLVGSSRHRSMRLTVVRQRDKMELVMKHFLVEDKGLDGSASYVDFLCHLHKEIRSIVS